jgi:transposase
LYLAFDLGRSEWKLAFSTAPAEAPRLRTIAAGDLAALQRELDLARRRWGLAETVPIRTCYEAGRDGFWLHRWLTQQGIANVIVDAASLAVNRRARQAKSDRLDASQLLRLLQRYHDGEAKVWSVVHVPTPADEDRRQLHRELLDLKAERTRHSNRIQGLLAGCGLTTTVSEQFAALLPTLRTWDDQPLPADLQQRLQREHARWQYVHEQIREVENERSRRIRRAEPAAADQAATAQVRQLLGLKGLGRNSAWLFVMEVFAWRQLRSAQQVGAVAGLTPTPYQSGRSAREQGISKAGNRRLRAMAVEIAWCWLRWQPASALSQWYQRRFGGGSSRQRRIGVVAVARRLLVALWRYLEKGEVPAGAELVDWRVKVGGRPQPVAP